jgi:hypothetical protein
MIKKYTYWLSFIILVTASLVISSCQKVSDLDIPSYISIDSISLNVTTDQGTASNKIVDAWVYAGNDLEGAFELPASFPVLKAGATTLSIQPGIKLNGISETRVPYPFYDTISVKVTLNRENEVVLGHISTRYKPTTVFGWIEDFEDPNLSLDTTARSSIKLLRVGEPSLVSAFPGEGNSYAAKISLPDDTAFFECISHDSFVFSKTLPEEKSYVFLELNYKSNSPLTVGMFIYGTQLTQQPVIVVNPSSSWNKIYINLTPTVSFNTDATKFRIYLSARKQEGETAGEIFLDNIKLLHF